MGYRPRTLKATATMLYRGVMKWEWDGEQRTATFGPYTTPGQAAGMITRRMRYVRNVEVTSKIQYCEPVWLDVD